MVSKKICVFTGTRAEYGLLKPLMIEIEKDKSLKLQLIVSCMHLSPEFGLTYKEIEKDGFTINKKIKILSDSDTAIGLAKSMALGLIGFTKAYADLRPDISVILGDRYEALAAATAAMIRRLPIAHLYGGEATFGVIDEAIRHSITKMSYLHFTSTERYRNRVIQLGEDPDRVFNVGALGLDNIRNLKYLSKAELEKSLGFKFNRHNLLITFHPVTLEKDTSGAQCRNLLYALDSLKETQLIFTKSNADIGGRIINRLIDDYVARRPHKSAVFTSLGRQRYLSLMRFVDAVVGNSSSGIIEAPSFNIGTVNVGDRQKGRIKAKSIIDCAGTKEDIKSAVRKLYSRKFQASLKDVVNPHGGGNSSKRIVKILKNHDTSEIKKSFYDIPFHDSGYGKSMCSFKSIKT